MPKIPPRELLENNHDFPGRYTFKAIGWMENGFAERVVATIRDEMDLDTDPPFRLRQTASGRHVSVTVEPWMETPDQVLDVYQRLRGMSGLIMLW